MISSDNLQKYRNDITDAFSETSSDLLPGTPLEAVDAEIREMISSYLTDAEAFYQRYDRVNEYASLTYAHGWFDAAIFLGYIRGRSPDLLLPEDSKIPCDQHDRLIEKTRRYDQMLHDALQSVEIAPESGSPMYKAAEYILKKAEDALTSAHNHPGFSYTKDLGILSYGYGWLDAGLRAGLYRIIAHSHLFTTETKRTE